MISYVSEGSLLPLSLQLFDYNNTKHVKAYVYDSNNNLVTSVSLSAIGALGLYVNNSVSMPQDEFVVAQYIVYDDAGYSIVSTSEGGTCDLFINQSLIPGSEIPTYIQLFNYNPNKFVKAFVTDSTNTPVSNSPVILLPVGTLGLYGASSLICPSGVPFLLSQYVVYDDSGYSIVSSTEGPGSDVFVVTNPAPGTALFPTGNLPYVGDTLLDYFQPMTFTQIMKSIGPTFQVIETPSNFSFQGVWQPFTSQHLDMKPHGQRAWSWFMLHADPSLTLNPDEVVTYQSNQYRVMEKLDYARYGYVEYHLVLDFSGSGPN